MGSGYLYVKQRCSRVATACENRCEQLYYRHVQHRPSKHWPRAHGQHLLGNGQDLAQIATLLRALFPESVEAVVRQADAICDHVFDLLGSGPTRLSPAGPPYRLIDWHRDFKSGYIWNPRAFHTDIEYGRIQGPDIRVPWELSRFQHLSTLGQAYVLTGNRAYATEFRSQIEDWIRANPLGFGVNWACTMDVAIRVANWLTAAEYFCPDDVLDGAFVDRLYSSVHEHAGFIRHHLELGGGQRTNHYLSDIVGLLFVAVHCPFFKESSRWLRFCIRELNAEMQSQVYRDGCHFEASTCYHRLVLELFFYATFLSAIHGRQSSDESRRQTSDRLFGPAYTQRLHQMFMAVLHLLKPNGHMPQIGDNDSGRFLTLRTRDMLDMRYLLCLGAVFFDEPELKVNEFGFSEDTLWLFGTGGYDAWNRLEGRSSATVASRSFPDAGWYVIRRGREYCLISCGPNGPSGSGGHAHNDKLSVELALNGRDVVVDPGTYVYTSCRDHRNQFRSTGHHNTVAVDGCDQSGPLNGDVFRLPDRTRIPLARLTETPGRTCFEGQIEYAGIVHYRTVSLDQQSTRWRVDDRVVRPGASEARVLFHLSPHVTVRGREILEKDSGRPLASFQVEGGRVAVQTYDYSPQYGVRVEAPCLGVRLPAGHETVVTTIFSSEGT